MYFAKQNGTIKLVGETGLEPAWISPQPPQDCAYTDSATRPHNIKSCAYLPIRNG